MMMEILLHTKRVSVVVEEEVLRMNSGDERIVGMTVRADQSKALGRGVNSIM